MTAAGPARRPRVLVVEDEMMIALMIEQALEDVGCDLVGPVSKLNIAMTMARDEPIDAAFLDINIRGDEIYPVAEILGNRGIPYVFSSGYGDWALPEAYRGRHRLTKPFTSNELEAMVRKLCDL